MGQTEAATRVPLVIVPSKNFLKTYRKTKIGTKVTSPVDQIDVFPTILEMAGIPNEYQPLSKYQDDVLPGVSLSHYFSNPDSYTRSVSVSEYGTFKSGGSTSGRTLSLRSKYFKYIAFTSSNYQKFEPLLFDYRGGKEFRMIERKNVINDPNYAEVAAWFQDILRNATRQNDDKAFALVKNQKPIDWNFSPIRGKNQN